MKITQITHALVGVWVMIKEPRPRNERGLSQSAENAILIAGAVAVAVAIVAAIRAFVLSRLPS
jgi:tRNA threonylcarbamoyladenosine modification (KEOPS) complex Cgi121 subunit